ncbi:hypothetical protein RI129_005066 [Pyrocoelia pectoralis]|uniref:Transmembrane protein 231 n=1 Tax=Pyrocoelia pectoralis TaxID=417401 RepID=A0AAN7VF27_9COLE
MVVLEIYSKCLAIKYKTYLISKATVFTLILRIISVVLPFFIVYNSRAFWMKHDSFYEQPTVNFRGEYIFSALTNNTGTPIFCNNFPFLQKFANFDRCPLLKVAEIRKNNHDKIDELQFSITVDINTLKMVSFYLMLTLDYALHTVCPMKMQSAIIVYNNCQNTPKEINLSAQLGLLQFTPLGCHQHRTNNRYNYPIVNDKEEIISKFDIARILQSYNTRNISTRLINMYTTYATGKSSEFTLNLRVQYPTHHIYYTPGFWQEMKWAWIQFLSVFIIFLWITDKIMQYVFDNRLLPFYEVSPLKKRI